MKAGSAWAPWYRHARDRALPPGSVAWRLARRARRAARSSWPFAANSSSALVELPARVAPRVLFISGCAGDSRRYRCEHALEGLRALGHDGLLLDEADRALRAPERLLAGFELVVLHRCPWTRRLGRLLKVTRELGVPRLFDADDLVFDPGLEVHRSPAGRLVDPSEVAGLRRTLEHCDAASCSTEPLARALRKLMKSPVFIWPNRASSRMLAEPTRRSAQSTGERFVVGYASGTPTHDADLASIVGPLARLLRERPEVELRLLGPVRRPASFEAFEGRVVSLAHVPWPRLPERLRCLDVNLAPVARGCPFAAAKSELKVLESALVGVPTVASPIDAYRGAIEDGVDGLLVDRAQAWWEALSSLAGAPRMAAEMGRAAAVKARRRYVPEASARQLLAMLADLR